MSDCLLCDEGLRPLFEALPGNAHLRELDCSDNNVSTACVRDVLLPAVRANASLRALRLAAGAQSATAEEPAREAEALLARRSAREWTE